MRTPSANALALAALSPAFFGLGCTPPEVGGTHETEAPGLTSMNGLTSINGLTSVNGLTSINGLTSLNGLTSINGLTSVNGMISTSAGRSTVSYIIRCALPAGRSITRNVSGTNYTFSGSIGVAPEWETGACGTGCQEHVTACVLAHVNASGLNVNLWLDGDSPALGWGQSTNHPYQEGSFFGNIFVSPPKAHFCNGKDFDMGLVPGRLGVASGGPYSNPFSSGSSYCKDHCVAPDYPNQNDGYKACAGFNHVVTVWRNFDPNTDYKVCNRHSGKCMKVVGDSLVNSARIAQNTYDRSKASMRWRISQISPGKYKFINVHSGKAMDMGGNTTNNGEQMNQYTYKASANQLWSFTPTGDGFYKFSPGQTPGASVDVPSWSTTEGTILEQYTWNSGSNQQWSIAPAL